MLTVLKYFFQSSSRKELINRCSKNFDGVIYKRELAEKRNQWIKQHKNFEQVLSEVLNMHAPMNYTKRE